MDNYVGKRLDGRYEIREIIGVGGMAVVYKAHDNIDDRIVAIKILKEEFLANEEFRRRFKNESKAIAVLSHPNIVKVYDVSLGDKLQYIVMEYVEGITLKEYIEQQG
ncbi:MAG TPA: protein kinase, partial [Clostridiales bacterium]|nr:protein kinase [Clostridiales bacterium]